MDRIKFVLDGCDISFVAEAPKDITLEQLLKQADRIYPDWCACGIRSLGSRKWDCLEDEVEVIFDYDDVRKSNDDVSCEVAPVNAQTPGS